MHKNGKYAYTCPLLGAEDVVTTFGPETEAGVYSHQCRHCYWLVYLFQVGKEREAMDYYYSRGRDYRVSRLLPKVLSVRNGDGNVCEDVKIIHPVLLF